MPDDVVITQWRQRTGALIAEAARVREALARKAPDFEKQADAYAHATRQYALANAEGEERDALLELSRRAGTRTIRFAQRGEVAWAQHRAETQLYIVNRQILVCHSLISAGKLAEAGLGACAWAKYAKEALDACKTAVDAVKTAQPFAAGALAGAGAGGEVSAGAAVDAIAQLEAFLLLKTKDFQKAGKALWDILGAIRRARRMADVWTASAAVAQLLKTLFDQLKNLIEFIEGKNRSGMAPWAGHLAAAFGVLRDLLEAGRGMIAAYDAYLAMREASEAMERRLADGDRVIGDEATALVNLPSLVKLRAEDVEDRLTGAGDFNAARLLADAARRKAAKIATRMAEAASFNDLQTARLRKLVRSLEPWLADADECLLRFRLQIVDYDFVADTPRGEVAKNLAARLAGERDKLREVCGRFDLLIGDR